MNPNWQIGPFERIGGAILGPNLEFHCPLRKTRVKWAAKDVFNPGAIVKDGEVCLLIRAEDFEGHFAGTSRVGLATSRDGLNFQIHPDPVIFPDDDEWRAWKWEGGCEDARVIENPNGGFVCLYTAFDGKHGGLFCASSHDLISWKNMAPRLARRRTPNVGAKAVRLPRASKMSVW